MQPKPIVPVPKRISSAWRIRSRRTSRSASRFLTHLRFAEFSAAASRKACRSLRASQVLGRSNTRGSSLQSQCEDVVVEAWGDGASCHEQVAGWIDGSIGDL